MLGVLKTYFTTIAMPIASAIAAVITKKRSAVFPRSS
jgi:hypothetical protein